MDRLEALERRLQTLENIEAIRTLRCRYHELVNEDRGPELWTLFSEDASVIYGGRPEVRGRDAIRTFFRDFPVQRARQFIHNHVVEVSGTTGRGYAYLDGRPVVGERSMVAVGRFDDEYVLTPQGWRFSRVELTVHYMIDHDAGWADRIPLRPKNPTA